MKRAGNVIKDSLPEYAAASPAETPEQAQARLEQTGRATPGQTEKVDYRAIAAASIAEGQRSQREARIAEQRREQEQAIRRAKTKLALTSLEQSLPQKFGAYMTQRPPESSDNRGALHVLSELEPGRSLHLWGPPGNLKTHMAVWGAARFIERHAARVKFLDERAIGHIAFAFKEEPPAFELEDCILVDDLDKVTVGEYQAAVVNRLLGRPERGRTLITTGNRPLAEIAARYLVDKSNREALLSRLNYIREVEVTGPDFRPVDASRRWPS